MSGRIIRMTVARELIAEVLRRNHPGPFDCGTCTAMWAAQAAAEIDKALGGLTRGTSGQWVSREVRS